MSYSFATFGLLAAAGVGETPAWQWYATGGVVIAMFAALITVSYKTKTGVIARATTKEAVRQPLFILLMAVGILLIAVNTILPFFSLGDDIKMLKDCGLATILISGLLLAIWTSSTSIASEIEGKTAMTLLSKPITRRQFIIGKYIGILQSTLFLVIPLMIVFSMAVFYKVSYDAQESGKEPPTTADAIAEVVQVIPGHGMVILEIAVLAAVSVAISTRMPMVVNMVTSLAIFVIGHITPVLVQSGAIKIEIVDFMAKLIATVLPNLDYFNMSAAVATGQLIPPSYLLAALAYSIVYGGAAILLSFILFEDRDLA
jgi:ABC-type transport system involved in multi-copper enzyme maturation permease subunit